MLIGVKIIYCFIVKRIKCLFVSVVFKKNDFRFFEDCVFWGGFIIIYYFGKLFIFYNVFVFK